MYYKAFLFRGSLIASTVGEKVFLKCNIWESSKIRIKFLSLFMCTIWVIFQWYHISLTASLPHFECGCSEQMYTLDCLHTKLTTSRHNENTWVLLVVSQHQNTTAMEPAGRFHMKWPFFSPLWSSTLTVYYYILLITHNSSSPLWDNEAANQMLFK